MDSNQFFKIRTIVIACILLIACKQPSNKKIGIGFYYWKTNLHLSNYEKGRLDSLSCKTLYVRFFDIDWNDDAKKPTPIAINKFEPSEQKAYSIVPVIFITQDLLNKIPTGEMVTLVQNFTNLLYEKCIQAKVTPTEIQVDCDWTVRNKQKFFHLLNLCKNQPFFKGKILSCTIRLHQIRYYQRTGIPPVDRGLLMCYNMGNLHFPGDNNSILDVNVAKSYLGNLKKYPLALDVAFPLFSWSLLYDEQNRFMGILHEVGENDLKNSTIFEHQGKTLYQIKADTLWRGYNLRRNETIRYESCEIQELCKLSDYISTNINNPSYSLLFYHLDSTVLSKYTTNELEKIYHLLH